VLGTDLRYALDPATIMQATGITPDPWQRDLLRGRARQMLLLCCRQAGKTGTSAAVAVDEAAHRPPALVLILAPVLRQSQESFRKVKQTLHALGEAAPPILRESALTLELVNGSRIVCLPGKEATIRGYSSVALIIVDEAARVSDDLYMSVRPMLAVSGGRILLLSTPWGKRGFFFHEYTEGGPSWHRVTVPATAVPRIDPIWLAAERARIGDWWYRQEYLCEFVETDDQVFGYDQVMRAISTDVVPLFPARPVAA
jgi:hypothetical protein